MQDPFEHGAAWVRADFHLHTQADREFKSQDRGDDFGGAFIARLLQEQVCVGVLANHNKFDWQEFKTLRKQGRETGIFLLPGVELSLQGGKGVHAVIVFDPNTWLDNRQGEDFVTRLLDAAFPQTARAQRESENANSDWHLGNLLEELEIHHQHGRDAFIVMAHVDEGKGCLEELRSQLGNYFNDAFRRFVLGFQKCRSRENWNNLKQWIGSDWTPAQLEGSDCKELAHVGRAHVEKGEPKLCYLKLGDFTFGAVRLALTMHRERVSKAQPQRENAWIHSISFESGSNGILGTLKVPLSADMNDLIGIRGSGKSSILECLRYALGLKLTKDGNEDAEYKDRLVMNAIGSGGKVTVHLQNPDGQSYVVERIMNEAPKVSGDGRYLAHLRPEGRLRCHYFGQKDLAKLGGRGNAGELLERFVAPRLSPIREGIFVSKQDIIAQLGELRRIGDTNTRMHETRAEIAAIGESLKVFKKHQVEKIEGADSATTRPSDRKESDRYFEFDRKRVVELRFGL